MAAPKPLIQEVPKRRLAAVPDGAQVTQRPFYDDLQFRPSINGWTPDLVNEAAASADAGNLRTLMDLVDAMMADDHVLGVLQTLTVGMLGLPLQIAGGSAELAECLRPNEGGIGGEWNAMHPETELVKLEAWGIMAGVGLAQRKPLPRVDGEMQRYRLVTWNPRCLSYDHNAASGSHWRVQTKQGQKPVIPGGQFVLYLPFGEKRPWNEGRWRACAFPWLVKRFSLEDRANQGEVVGSPTWVGTSKQGGTERQRQRFLAELRQLGRNGRIVLPEGWELNLKEAAGRTWEIFSESTEWADNAMTIALVSQVTTTNGAPGFDSGKPQDQLLSAVTRYYAKSLASCLHVQSTEPWAHTNTGNRKDAPCGYWVTERANSQASLATTLETVGRAGPELDTWLAAHGLEADAEALTSTFAIPIKKRDPNKPLPSADEAGRSRTPPKEPGTPGPAKDEPEIP